MSQPSNRDAPAELGPAIRTVKIISVALMMGILSFAFVAFSVRARQGLFAPDAWSLAPPKAAISLLGLAMAAFLAGASFFLPRLVTTGSLKQLAAVKPAPADDTMPLMQSYSSQMIIGLALLEGAAFFNLIAFLLEGRIPGLIATALLMLLMLARFPTRSGVETWIEDRAVQLREERMAA